jgi:hypothetical protein
MNERIKELLTPKLKEWGGASGDNFSEELEKFAELIVKECAQAFEAEVDTWKEMEPYQGSMKRKGTQAIRKHFGVEE